MTTLVTTDADQSPVQEFTLATNQRIHVQRIALWLYANDIGDSDTFALNLYDAADLLVWSKELTGSDIKAQIGSDVYAHGKLFIDTENELILSRGVYSLELSQLTGYTSNNYLAWARDWESTYQRTYGDDPVNDGYRPFYFRLYDLKGREVSK